MTKKLISKTFDKCFLDVEKETIQKETNRYYLWIEWYDTWVSLFKKWSLKNIEEKRLLCEMCKCAQSKCKTSTCVKDIQEQKRTFLLLYRFLGLKKHLIWICKCVHSGAYHTALRELRFVFESFLQAYYVDKEHPDSSIMCKLEIVKEIDKLIGNKLIDNTDLQNKEKLKKRYSDLCAFVHSSYQELESPINKGKIGPTITFIYDEELFDKCYVFTNGIMDAVIFVLLSSEAGIITNIQKDEQVMNFLKKNKCELSSNLLATS